MVCFGLGAWQLQRHYWKADLLAQAAQAASAPAISLPGDTTGLTTYGRYALQGTFLGGKDIVIRGFALNGVSGSRLYAPFELTDGRVVIVQRGWVARGQEDKSGVQVRQDQETLAAPQEIEVIWRRVQDRTSHRSLFSLVNAPEAGLWTFIDPRALAAHWQLPTVITAGYGELRAPFEAAQGPHIEAFSSDLFNRHLEYVATWWSLAMGILGIFVLIWWDRRRRGG